VRAAAIAFLILATGTASADDSFESRAASARKLKNLDDVVWAFAAPCDRGDDTQQRQCRQLRDRFAGELAGQTLLVDADPDALEIDKWNPGTKKSRIALTGCIRCGGLEVDGHTYYVAGAASAPRMEGKRLKANAHYDTAKPFADEAAATAWAATVKNRRVQLLVKVPDKRGRVGDTVALDILGFRVFTPCNGEIVIAQPPSGPLPADRAACATGDTVAVAAPDGVTMYTPVMVRDAMKPVVAAAQKCHANSNIKGAVTIDMSVSGDGSMLSFTLDGDFKGTPVGTCIEAAMKSVKFPRSQQATNKVKYPFKLP
jgi:hypothetical protein